MQVKCDFSDRGKNREKSEPMIPVSGEKDATSTLTPFDFIC